MRFDEGDFRRRQFLLDHHRHILGPRSEALDARADLGRVQMQAVGDAIDVIRLQVLPREQQREGGLIIDDHAAIAVENFAARREHRNGLDAIALGQFAVAFAVANLQHPEAGDQEQKDRNDEILETGDAPQREASVVVREALRRRRACRSGSRSSGILIGNLQFIQDVKQRYGDQRVQHRHHQRRL